MKQINLCYLSYLDFSVLNGATTHARNFLENIAELDSIGNIYVYGYNVTKSRSKNQKIHRINLRNIIPFLPYKVLFSIPHLLLELIWSKKNVKVDLIYERHSFSSPGIFFGKLLGIPAILEVDALVAEEERAAGEIKNEALLEWIWQRECNSFARAAAVIVVSKYFKETLIRVGIPSDKIFLIPNGVDTKLFRPLNQKKCRAELGLDQGAPLVVYVGSFGPWQGLQELLKAMRMIAEESPRTRLVLVGDGPLRQDLERMTKEFKLEKNIIFVGRLTHNLVPKYINAADVCVVFKTGFRKDYEPSPLKLYEYMACNRPIIASKTPGLEIVQKIKVGILVDPNDQRQVTEAVLSVVQNPTLVEEMAKNGRDYVIKNHSWKEIATKTAKILARAH